MTKRFFAVWAVLGVLLFSFSSLLAEDDYYPMDIGATWEYSMEIKDRGAEMTRVMEERVVGTKVINGKQYFTVIKGVAGNPSKQMVGYIRKGEDGIYAIDGRYPGSPEQVLMRLPLMAGTAWVNTTPSGRETSYRVIGRETVFVNGKKYTNAVKIHAHQKTRSREYEGYTYYAPNVGQIKMIKNRMHDSSSSMKMELLSFEKKK